MAAQSPRAVTVFRSRSIGAETLRLQLAVIALFLSGLVACNSEDSQGTGPLGPSVSELMGIAGFPGRGATPPQDADFHAQATRDVGMTWVRGDLVWERIQPARERWDWTRYDRVIDEVGRDGKRIIGLLVYGARWANADPPPMGSAFPPDDPADFAAFAAAAADRYRDKVSVWEIWNEPNSLRFWQPTTRGDPAAYGRLLAAAYPAIKAVNPDATVLFGGLFFHDQGLTTAAPEFVDAAHRAHPDLAEAYDGMALHPYDLYPPRRGPDSAEDGSLPVQEMVTQVRQVMADHGAPDRGVWVTELGWPTFAGVSDEEQASYLVRAALLLAASGVRTICWYTLWDGPNPSDIVPEDQFGLFRWQEASPTDQAPTPKPAYEALRQLNTRVGDLSFVTDESDETRRRLVFGDAAGRRVTAVWDPVDTTLPSYQ